MTRVARAAPLLVVLSWALGGCADLPPRPEHGVTTARAQVWAASPTEARRVADLVGELHARVLTELGSGRRQAPEVWIVPDLAQSRGGRIGVTFQGALNRSDPLILVHDDLVDSGVAAHVLAHELVHYTLARELGALPTAIEEGLCEAIAARATGEPRVLALRQLVAYQALPTDAVLVAEGRARVTLSFGSRLSLQRILADQGDSGHRQDSLAAHYGLGTMLVHRILARGGLPALRALRDRAAATGLQAVPPDWILAAAEVEGLEQLQRAAIEALQEGSSLLPVLDLIQMPAALAVVLEQPTTEGMRATFSTLSPLLQGQGVTRGQRARLLAAIRARSQPERLERLLALDPRLELEGFAAPVRLAECASVRALLEPER